MISLSSAIHGKTMYKTFTRYSRPCHQPHQVLFWEESSPIFGLYSQPTGLQGTCYYTDIPSGHKKDVQHFLWFLGYYHSRFIPHFATLAYPLTELTQGKRSKYIPGVGGGGTKRKVPLKTPKPQGCYMMLSYTLWFLELLSSCTWMPHQSDWEPYYHNHLGR